MAILAIPEFGQLLIDDRAPFLDPVLDRNGID
jgi:hypothetical protein